MAMVLDPLSLESGFRSVIPYMGFWGHLGYGSGDPVGTGLVLVA